MPTRRLSIDQAQTRGSDQVNAGRFIARKSMPSTIGKVGAPPKHFSKAEKACWKEIAAAIPDGVAGSADRIALEMSTKLLCQFRADAATMQASRIAILMNLLSRLGLDPQARTRLHVAPSAETKHEDALAKFMHAVSRSPLDTVQ